MLSQHIRQNEDYLNALSGILARNLASMLELDRRATDIDDLLGSMCEVVGRASAKRINTDGSLTDKSKSAYIDCEEGEKDQWDDDQLLKRFHSGYRCYLNEKIALAHACSALVEHGEKLAQETSLALENAQDVARHSLRSNNSR